MKKKKLVVFCIGIIFIFSGVFCVLAKGRAKKIISGKFRCVFNDGTMNKKYYDKNTIDCVGDDNKTNANHVFAIFLWAYLRINKLKEQGVEISKEVKEAILENFSPFCREYCFAEKLCSDGNWRDGPSKHLVTSGILWIDLSEQESKILHKMFHIENVEITQDAFNDAKEDLMFRFYKEIKSKKDEDKKIVIVPDLFKKDSEGRIFTIKQYDKLCEEYGLQDKIAAYDKEDMERMKNIKKINILTGYSKEIEKTNFEEVKSKLEKFEWTKHLLDVSFFYEDIEGDYDSWEDVEWILNNKKI